MQENVDYATTVARTLSKYDLVPQGFTPPRLGFHNPDIILTYNEQRVGCEVRPSLDDIEVDLEYHVNNRSSPWQFAYISTNDHDGTFLKAFANDQNLLHKLKKDWDQMPLNLTKQSAEWNRTIGQIPMKERYERDVEVFPRVDKPIVTHELETFYNARKNTFYMNVAKFGLFVIGSYNPLNIDVPRLSDFLKCKYYAELDGNERKYKFVFGMNFNLQGQSPINIDPTYLNLSGFGIA